MSHREFKGHTEITERLSQGDNLKGTLIFECHTEITESMEISYDAK
jgi:hypothetical protein